MPSQKSLNHSRDKLQIRPLMNTTAFHLYSIWLFTFSDLKTIVFPETAFGILTATSTTVVKHEGVGFVKTPDILHRIPYVMFWVWINLLPFSINNQRRPEAIAEDAINKPWRTMPSQRWTSIQAKFAMLFFYLVAVVVSWRMGSLRPSLALIALGCWYNDGGGSDGNGITRNLINALGFTCFGAGALEIALGSELSLERIVDQGLANWQLVIATVVITTVHIQDIPDQKGDEAKGRVTLPLQIGDGLARWTITVAMVVWGFFCPYFWRCGWLAYSISTSLALVVAYRMLVYRTTESDKTTFRIWNFWMASLYTLPLLQHVAV
ncbi:UbiA prenyltransferase family-domain-containing protein [Hypomontagnella monticulosa]|nr:UbiA prenyltransferase family-domain-containing protein [Hypomontagnella monticulosa]